MKEKKTRQVKATTCSTSWHSEWPYAQPSSCRSQETSGNLLWPLAPVQVAALEFAHVHLFRLLLRSAPWGTRKSWATGLVSQ